MHLLFCIFSEELARQLQAEENRAQESQRPSEAAALAAASAVPSTSGPQGSPGRPQVQGSPQANNSNKKVHFEIITLLCAVLIVYLKF